MSLSHKRMGRPPSRPCVHCECLYCICSELYEAKQAEEKDGRWKDGRDGADVWWRSVYASRLEEAEGMMSGGWEE